MDRRSGRRATGRSGGGGGNLFVDGKAGVGFPQAVEFSVSADGENFTRLPRKEVRVFYKRHQRKKAMETLASAPLLVLVTSTGKSGRYVRVSLKAEADRLLVDEVVINPEAGE